MSQEVFSEIVGTKREKRDDDRLFETVCDGKYTYVMNASGQTFGLRYGEVWINMIDAKGHGMTLALASTVEELRIENAELKKELGR